MAMLQALESSLAERDEKLAAILADRDALDDEVKHLRAEVAKAKVANEAQSRHARLLRGKDPDPSH